MYRVTDTNPLKAAAKNPLVFACRRGAGQMDVPATARALAWRYTRL